MPRPKKKDPRSMPVTGLLPVSMYQEIDRLVHFYDRSESYIVYRLIERGLAAHKRDGKLTEDGPPGAIERIPVKDILDDERETKKKKRA